jgi:1-acyl-sn-glycerol-3-phosphate acyltransferase
MGALTWVALVALFFYLTPFLRLLSRPLRAVLALPAQRHDLPFNRFLVKIGRLEYLLGPFRDRLLSIILLTIVVFLWIYRRPLSRETLIASSLIVFFNLLAVITIRYRDNLRLKLTEIGRCHSTIHPSDFFDFFYVSLSPWPPPFFYEGFRQVTYNEANYQTGEAPVKSFWPLVEASLATSTLARMAILAYKRVGPEYGRDAFDGLARLWGSRIAQIFKARLIVSGGETIPPLEGKTLLLFNHKSYLDFALNFFALGGIRTSAGRHLRPRFIAAKDHFVDNPLLYSWIGIGRIIENSGMIFVNRQKGKGWAAIEEAAYKLVNSDVEIAVYPQGTRAIPMESPEGERRDAGYYTTFTKKTWDQPLGHLKPGTAHLILNTLIELKKKGETRLNILVAGIRGTATAGPKGSFKIQSQTEIEFCLAPLWVLSASLAEGISSPRGSEPATEAERLYVKRIDELQEALDRHLLIAMHWHRELLQRAQIELEKIGIPSSEIQAVKDRMRKADQAGDSTPTILLDRIFSLKPDLWERFLRLFVSLQNRPMGDEAWKALLQEVSERLRTR